MLLVGLVAAALLIVTVGRAAFEAQAGLRRGMAAESNGDLDGARLRYGEARLWHVPGLPWAAEAERKLRELPTGPRAALGGAPVGRASGSRTQAFGRVPDPVLSFIGALAMLAGLSAAARWAWTARTFWAAVTVAGGCIAAIALGAA